MYYFLCLYRVLESQPFAFFLIYEICSPQGFLADTLGSYAPSFYLAGGVLLLCAVLPFVLLCVKAKNRNDESDQEMIAVEEDGQILNVSA